MFECPRAVKHEDSKDAAFLAITAMPCIREGIKGHAVYGHWIIVTPTRDYLSESGMVFISDDDIGKWKEYVPRK